MGNCWTLLNGLRLLLLCLVLGPVVCKDAVTVGRGHCHGEASTAMCDSASQPVAPGRQPGERVDTLA